MEVAFTVYSDFENYAGGIYHHVSGGWLADMPLKWLVGASRVEPSIGRSPTAGIHIGERRDTSASFVAQTKEALRTKLLPPAPLQSGAGPVTRLLLSRCLLSKLLS